jgi:hypothetical protein
MSAILESLLTQEQRAAASAHDRALKHYVPMAAQAAKLTKPTQHQRIADKLAEVEKLLEDAEDWADDDGALESVRKAAIQWDCTYSRFA